jgi:hypothetical protein
MASTAATTAVIALVFALVHLVGARMRFLGGVPRSLWLSTAGGVSVAYVFVHLLPELAAHQARAGDAQALAADRGLYLLALTGLALFYGLERLVRQSARGARQRGEPSRASTPAFWLHLGSFALYNLLVGYLLLHREESDARGLAIYAVAMALHFIVNDQGLRQMHGAAYDRQGRWLLAAAPVAGWLLGLRVTLPPAALAAAFALLAGSVLLNVLKEELPEERESRFWAFAAGAAAYAALLLAG